MFFLFSLYSKEYSINDVLDVFEKNNYDLKKIEKMSNSLKKNMEMEETDLMDIMFSYSIMDLSISEEIFNPEMIKHKFSLKQEIPISGKNYFKKKIAQIDYLNSLEELKEKKIMLKRMLLSNIIDLHLSYEIEKNRKNELDLLQKANEIVKIRYSTGKAMLTSVIESDVKITDTMNMILMINNMQSQLKNEIVDILDVTDDELSINIIMNHKLIDISKIEPNSLFDKAIKNFPSFKVKDNDIEKIEREINLTKDQFVPDLNLMFDYTLKPSPMLEHSFGIGIELNLPLLSSIGGTKKIDMYNEEKKVKQLDKLSYENEIKNYIKRKIIDLKSTIEQADLIENRVLKLSQNNVNALFSAYQVEKVEFEMLLSSIIMVYDLQNKYFEFLGKIYKILFDLEMLSGEKFYDL